MAAKRAKSKKRSAANSRQPETRTFFLDRALGNNVVADALRAAGYTVVIHADHFAPAARDEEWLVEVGRRGWIVFTKDEMIQRRPLERTALLNAGVRAFILVSGNLIGIEMAEVFVQLMPKIERFCEKHQPPFIARVYKSLEIKLLDLPDNDP